MATTAKKKTDTAAAPAAAKKTSTKAAAAAPAAEKATGFMKPLKPSADLAAVIGADEMPRTEVTKKIWEYIKANNLQDAKDKRQINADAKLAKVFGGKKQVSMFEMTKLISAHLK